MTQSNTRYGDFPIAAAEDLTGKEDRLVELVNSSGTAVVQLPSANTDYALYLLVEGAASGENVTVRPLTPERNVRVLLKGTCNPGDTLVLADVGTAADKGKVRALPASAGTYRGLLIAEEAGVDGQLVLARPNPIGNLTVS